jgi:hypothetical protein
MELSEASLLSLQNRFSIQEVRVSTFLEKIKVSEGETIMANLLAYYFWPQKEHGLGDLYSVFA